MTGCRAIVAFLLLLLLPATDASAFEVLWTRKFDVPIDGDFVPSGSTLFLRTGKWPGDENGELHAADAATGKDFWVSRGAAPGAGDILPVGNVVLSRIVPLPKSAEFPKGRMSGLIAFDRTTGREVWRKWFENKFDQTGMAADGSEGFLLLLWPYGIKYLLASDGAVLWEFDPCVFDKDFKLLTADLPPKRPHPCDDSEVNIDFDGMVFGPDAVYVSSGEGAVYSLDKKTGAMRWSTYIPRKPWWTEPIRSILEDGRLYVAFSELSYNALDAGTGKLLWQADIRPNTHPLKAGKRIFVTSGMRAREQGYTNEFTLFALDADTGKTLWKFPGGYFTKPVFFKGLVWVATGEGELLGFDPETGAKKERLALPGGKPGGIEADAERLYVSMGENTLYAVR